MDTGGARLREARRQRKLTLGDISKRTKIPIHALEAIERNELDRLPRGIFTRGFLRGYAREVGLDPEQIVRACFPPPVIEVPPDRPGTPTHGVDGQRGRNGILVAAAIGLVLVLGVYSLGSRKPPAQPPLQSVPLHLDGTVSTLPEIPVSRFSSVVASIRPELQVSSANIAARPNAGNNESSIGTEERPRATSGIVPPRIAVPTTTDPGGTPSSSDPPAPSAGAPANGAVPLNATPNEPPREPPVPNGL
jgi:hypothetical protein